MTLVGLLFILMGVCLIVSLPRVSSWSAVRDNSAEHILDDLRHDMAAGSHVEGKALNMALLYCESMFDQHSGEVAFLKLYGELLLEKSESEGAGGAGVGGGEEERDLGMQLLEEAVVVFEREMQQMQQEALTGHLEAAYQRGEQLLQSFPEDFLLNLELGVIQFMRQEFDQAASLCQTAVASSSSDGTRGDGDSQAYSCLGVAATYLGLENIALPALYRAYELRHMPYAISSAIFTVPPAAIRGSLIHGLGNFGRSAECVEVGAAMLGLPASPAARAYIVIFAVVEWTSAEKIAGLEELEKTLRHRGLFPPAEGVNPSFSLLAEIRRVQQDHMGLLTPLAGCVRTGEHTAQWALTALEDIHSLVHGTGAEARTTELDRVDAAFSPHHWHSFSRMQTGTGAGAEPSGPAGPSVPHQNPDTSTDAGAGAGSAGVGVQGIALITQHYRESSAGRDLMVALVKNLMNPYISEVYLFNNEEFDFSELPHAHKIHQLVMESREGSVEGRLTFQNAFDFASAELRGRTVIIANADIYFDHSLSSLGDHQALPSTSVLAVSKWKDWWQSSDQHSTLLDVRSDSQDAWIFRSLLPSTTSTCVSQRTAVLAMGEVGCDNRLVEALRACGLTVTNPALFLRAVEYSSKLRVTTVYSHEGGGGGGGSMAGRDTAYVLLADSPPGVTFAKNNAKSAAVHH